MPQSWTDMVAQGIYYNLTGAQIPDLPFNAFKNTYLAANDVREIIEILTKYGETLAGLPPRLNHYKNIALDFINSVLVELEAYIKLLGKINSRVTPKNIADFKKEISNLYGRIKVLCDNRELSKYTARYYNEHFKNAKLTKKVNNYVGDFAFKFSEFLGKSNVDGLNEANIILSLIGRNKDVLRKNSDSIGKLKGKVLSWLGGKAIQFITPNVRGLSDAELLYDPIEFYEFGQWLDSPAVNACTTIMGSYISTLNNYPIELSDYKKDSLDIIRFTLSKLKDYNTVLGLLSKPDLSDKQIIDSKTKLYRILILLKKKFEPVLKEGTNIYDVMSRAANRGDNKGSADYIKTGNAAKKAIVIDGWSMGDFLTPLLKCVNNTIEGLNQLINPAKAEGKIDYVTLGIKEPPKSNSKLKKAGKAVRDFFSGSKNEASVFIKNRKTLISYVEKAQKLYNDAKSLSKKVDSLKKSLEINQVPVQTESFGLRAQEINDSFSELGSIYKRVSCDEEHFYRDLTESPELIKNGKINVSSSIVPPIWTPEKCTLLADYISRDLDEMQELYNDLAENAQDLLRIYKDTLLSITKERSKLNALLQMIIDIKVKADGIEDDFSKWNSSNFDVFFAGSVPGSEQIWFNKQKEPIDKVYSIIENVYGWFRSATIALSNGGILDKLEFISIDGKINTTTLNGISLSQFKDVVGFISTQLNMMKEDLSKLKLTVENLKKNFEKRKKDYILERSKLEKFLKKSIDVFEKSYRYTDECASIADKISRFPDSNVDKQTFNTQYGEIGKLRKDRHDAFLKICKYKPNDSDDTYTLVDDKNKIGSGVKNLDLDLLGGAIKNCSEALKALEQSAKEVLQKEETLCKEYKKIKS